MNYLKYFYILMGVMLLFYIAYENGYLPPYEYKQKQWEHETRMLDLEYQMKLIELKSKAELRLLIYETDSLINAIPTESGKEFYRQ